MDMQTPFAGYRTELKGTVFWGYILDVTASKGSRIC